MNYEMRHGRETVQIWEILATAETEIPKQCSIFLFPKRSDLSGVSVSGGCLRVRPCLSLHVFFQSTNTNHNAFCCRSQQSDRSPLVQKLRSPLTHFSLNNSFSVDLITRGPQAREPAYVRYTVQRFSSGHPAIIILATARDGHLASSTLSTYV